MNSPDVTVLESYYLDGLSKITREIVEKSANGNYIYRGEPEHYEEEPYFGKVSSALYRLVPQEYDSGRFNLEHVQEEILEEAKNHIRERAKDDFEILTELQHFGNPTNLLDFTTDYRIALFFACDGSHDKAGRIILLKRTEEINKKYRIIEPQNPQNRVIAQKSVFAQPPNGFIDSKDTSIIPVAANLKQWILIHLRKFQDISTQSIYNDLHGFIRHRNLRSSREAIYPLIFADRALESPADENQTIEERKDQLQRAIGFYTTAIQYSPYDATTYVKQGRCYGEIGEFDHAIQAFSKAILLDPGYANAYFYRGWTYFRSSKIDLAIADYSKAIELKSDYANVYHHRGIAYCKKGDYCRAAEDLTKAIVLNPDDASRYYIRGMMQLNFEKWKEGKSDLITAKDKGHDINTAFHKVYPHIEDFKSRHGSDLPQDIAAILQPS